MKLELIYQLLTRAARGHRHRSATRMAKKLLREVSELDARIAETRRALGRET